MYDEPDRIHYDSGSFHYVGLLSLRNFYTPVAQAEGEGVIDADALIAFSLAAAMGAAALFSDEAWCNLLAVDDVDGLADEVLDLVVHRSRTAAVPTPNDKARRAS